MPVGISSITAGSTIFTRILGVRAAQLRRMSWRTQSPQRSAARDWMWMRLMAWDATFRTWNDARFANPFWILHYSRSRVWRDWGASRRGHARIRAGAHRGAGASDV